MALYWIIVLLSGSYAVTRSQDISYFREVPQSTHATLGSSIQFRCQAAAPVGAVTWHINHQPWSRLIPPSATHNTYPDASWDYPLHTLEMPALREYNNSIVQCVLIMFGNPNILSDEVSLVIQAHINMTDFRESPQSVNATLDSTVHFHCQTAVPVNEVAWYINHAPVNQLNSPNITQAVGPPANRSHPLHTLQMPALQEYNNSVVQCALITSGRPHIFTDEATLAIQGHLDAVQELHVAGHGKNYIYISWVAPSSLDISISDPDIWYSISIHDVTYEGNKTAITCNNCHNLTKTGYNFTVDHPDSCAVYEFIVTPWNAVGRGEESLPVIGYFYRQKSHTTNHRPVSSRAATANPTRVETDTKSKTSAASCPETSCTMTGIGMGIAIGATSTTVVAILVTLCVYALHRRTNHSSKMKIQVNMGRGKAQCNAVVTHPNEAYQAVHQPTSATNPVTNTTNSSPDDIYERII